MADRHDYYFRQQVTEAELDEGFEWLEQADWNLVVDQGLDGITSGLGVAEDAGTPDLTVDVAGGTAYSHDGERINVVGTQDVDLSVDDLAVSTAVGSGGNEKWVSLFVEFDRVLGDARIDGAAMTVYFDRLESYAFSVVQGVEAGSGLATRPALDPSKVLLCDVLLTFGQTQIFDADINTDRRETRTFASSAFAYGGGPTWADGTTNPATTVEGQLDKIITNLAQEPAGSDRILSAAIAGSPNALDQGSIYNQLGQLLADINDLDAAKLDLASGGTVAGDITLNASELVFTSPRSLPAGDPGANRFEPSNMIHCWARCAVSRPGAPAATVSGFGYGVDSVAFNGNGIRITWDRTFTATSLMIPFAGINNPLNTPSFCRAVAANETQLDIFAYDDGGTVFDLSARATNAADILIYAMVLGTVAS